MTRFVLTPVANLDLEEILDYIATDSIEYSFKVRERFDEVFEMLGVNPRLGHSRQDLTRQGHRFFPVYSYLVIYQSEVEPIRILRILSSTRDLKRLLD